MDNTPFIFEVYIVDWTAVQIEYEQGATPKELAERYNLTPKQISDKAYANGWIENKKEQQSAKVEKSRKKYEKEINQLLDSSFRVLGEIIDNEEAKDSDRISAIRSVIDISGLKTENQEFSFAAETQEAFIEHLRNFKNAD